MIKMKNLFLFIVTIIVLNLSISQASDHEQLLEKDKYGGTLMIAMDRETGSLDARYIGESSGDISGHRRIYERLAGYSEKGVAYLSPLLAENWQQLDDLTWIVKIRKGVKYHNGKTLTAKDIKNHFDWKINVPHGWKPPRSRSRTYMLKKVELIDDYTLKFELKYPFSLFVPIVLGWGLRGVGDSDQILDKGEKIVTQPVGTAPFKFKKWVSGDHIIIERFEDYWGKKAYLDRVVFRTIADSQTRLIALQKGEVDIAIIANKSIPTAKKDPNIKIYQTVRASGRNTGFLFNLRRWPMNQIKFRKAIAMGVDWDYIMRTAFPNELKITRSLLEDSIAYNPNIKELIPSYNVKKAKELLYEVGMDAGKTIPPLYCMTRRKEPFYNFMLIIAENLKKLGLRPNVHAFTEEVVKDKKFRDPKIEWDMGLMNLKSAGVDPFFLVNEFLSENNVAPDGKNIMGYTSVEIDSLVKEVLKVSDEKKRITIYQDIEKNVMKDLPGFSLFRELYTWGVNKRVQDFAVHNSGYFYLATPWCNIWLKD